MRLYIKLFSLVLATATIQKYLFDDGPPSELWFGLRCSYAYIIDDKPMIQRLVTEAHTLNVGARVTRMNCAGG